MADENPAEAASDSEDEEAPPADDSFLLGASGVEEQVLAELGRAEASLKNPEEAADDSEGAVV